MKWDEIPEDIREEFSALMRVQGHHKIIDHTAKRGSMYWKIRWAHFKHRLGFHTMIDAGRFQAGSYQYLGLRCMVCGLPS